MPQLCYIIISHVGRFQKNWVVIIMKKYIFLIIAIVLAIVLFTLFFQTTGGDSLSYKPVDENENKIYIGVFEPFTGINSLGGYQEKLGIMYANEKCPTVDIGGVTYDVKLIYSDNESEQQAAAKAARGLVDKKVSAILGSYGSAVTLSGAEIFQDAKIPAVGISCTSPEITADYSCYYRVCFLDSFQGEVMANYAYTQDLRKAAVLTQVGDPYSKGLGDYFASGFEALGGQVEFYNFNTVTMSFASLIKEIEASGADFVYMPSPTESAVMFINQMREKLNMMPIFGGDTWDTAKLIRDTGNNGQGVYFTSEFDEYSDIDSSGADFVSKFSTWLSEEESRIILNGDTEDVAPVSALAYDAYMVLIKAIETAGSTAPQDIMQALKTVTHEGVCGDIAFDKNGDCGRNTAFIKTINVHMKRFETLQVSNA